MRLRVLLALILIPTMGSAGATYTLTVNTAGSGTVSKNPTNSVYPEGAIVVLTATPSSNWIFNGWSGAASGVTNPLNVTMNSNKIITTTFTELPRFRLILTTNGLGTITSDPPGGLYLSNATVQLQAVPASGWRFLSWSRDVTGSLQSTSVVMNADKAVAANFAQPPQINTQPQSVALGVGENGSLTVAAVGTNPLDYQWWFNDSRIPGATSASLLLTNVQATLAGSYRVVVSNIAGVTTSTSVFVEVTNACSGSNIITRCTEEALRFAITKGGLAKFCCNGTITLSNTIAISNEVVLDAAGFSVVLSGNNAVRLFQVNSSGSLSLTNLWLVNGFYRGSNGIAAGTHGEPAEGGAILNEGGTVLLSACILTNNHVIGGAAADMNNSSAAEGKGGALANRGGTFVMEGIIAVDNAAVGGTNGFTTTGGESLGGMLFSEGGATLIQNSFLSGNSASSAPGGMAKGGAVYLASGTLQLSDSTLEAGLAAGGNGIFRLGGSGIFAAGGFGGAIYLAGGTASVVRVNILQNNARGGDDFGGSGEGAAGGIYSEATLTILQSTFSSNHVVAGTTSGVGGNAQAGALLSKNITTINDSTFSHNSVLGANAHTARGFGWNGGDGRGGAVVNEGFLAITNATFALNWCQSGNSDGGQPGAAFGGALFSSTGIIYMANVTIASNFALAGTPFRSNLVGGANIANSNGTVTLRNSLIAYGTNGNGSGPLTDGGFNISSDGSLNLNSGSSFSFTDPRLGPLKDNGGPTLTMGLLADSPAIDFGNLAGAPLTDQRGFPRPYGSTVDIGAFEAQLELRVRQVGPNIVLSFKAETNQSYQVEASADLLNWHSLETIASVPPSQIIMRDYPANESRKFFRVEAATKP